MAIKAKIISFKPKFDTPKENRVWKWELAFTPIADQTFKDQWRNIVINHKTSPMPNIVVDFRRMNQSELEK